ncbi:MAG: hypothetical protein KCHDKBKB_02875 [Elusimicrobia bacterium]|nr:hypothetical protein [Elusimicrobiota bacterium]
MKVFLKNYFGVAGIFLYVILWALILYFMTQTTPSKEGLVDLSFMLFLQGLGFPWTTVQFSANHSSFSIVASALINCGIVFLIFHFLGRWLASVGAGQPIIAPDASRR